MVRPTAQFMEVQATLESVLVNAEIMAELTARFLTAWRQTSGWKAQSRFPAEFLLDVGGILRIVMLAQAGLLPTLGLDEVPAEDLLARLTNRLAENPLSFELLAENCQNELTKKVLFACASHLALAAPKTLGVEVAVQASLSENALAALADFLYEHRGRFQLKDEDG